MTLKIGSLFSGFGGLDQAVEEVFDARTAWVSDIDKGACKILAHRYPDVPNLGDITAIDWASVEPIDILTGGSPCQDLSHAGKRAGMTEGTRSNLWVAMREAIAQLKPTYVIWENVRGAYSAAADSDLEPCAGCVGDATGTHLRALGRVLGDLSELGFDARWHGLRAADVGACHGRYRVFVVAHAQRGGRVGEWAPQLTGTPGDPSGDCAATPHTQGHGWDEGRTQSARLGGRPDVAERGDETVTLFPTPTTTQRGTDANLATREGARANLHNSVALLPTPKASNNENRSSDWANGPNLGEALALLPTPAVNDMGAGKTVEHWDEWTDAMKAKHGNGNGHGPSLSIEALRLLPTPTTRDHKDHMIRREPHRPDDIDTLSRALTGVKLLPTPSVADTTGGHKARSGARSNEPLLNGAVLDFGPYAAAVNRWESVLGRPAPAPTEPTGRNGAHRLSAKFVEWMMGCDEGWITDVPGVTRNEALKALGNGVVKAQAVAALRLMLAQERGAA